MHALDELMRRSVTEISSERAGLNTARGALLGLRDLAEAHEQAELAEHAEAPPSGLGGGQAGASADPGLAPPQARQAPRGEVPQRRGRSAAEDLAADLASRLREVLRSPEMRHFLDEEGGSPGNASGDYQDQMLDTVVEPRSGPQFPSADSNRRNEGSFGGGERAATALSSEEPPPASSSKGAPCDVDSLLSPAKSGWI